MTPPRFVTLLAFIASYCGPAGCTPTSGPDAGPLPVVPVQAEAPCVLACEALAQAGCACEAVADGGCVPETTSDCTNPTDLLVLTLTRLDESPGFERLPEGGTFSCVLAEGIKTKSDAMKLGFVCP
jgi:hypothetical protein